MQVEKENLERERHTRQGDLLTRVASIFAYRCVIFLCIINLFCVI